MIITMYLSSRRIAMRRKRTNAREKVPLCPQRGHIVYCHSFMPSPVLVISRTVLHCILTTVMSWCVCVTISIRKGHEMLCYDVVVYRQNQVWLFKSPPLSILSYPSSHFKLQAGQKFLRHSLPWMLLWVTGFLLRRHIFRPEIKNYWTKLLHTRISGWFSGQPAEDSPGGSPVSIGSQKLLS